jgi:hypothetical protein
MTKPFHITYCFVFLVLSACGGTKNAVGSINANAALSSKAIIKAHNNARQDFNTLAARMQVRYEDAKQSQSITTSVRMEKDKVIWIKASILGITLAKVLITPAEVSFYESIGRTYFKGDFSLLSDFLGTEINFKQAQAIFLGQSILELNPSKYNTTIVANAYEVRPKTQDPRFILSMLLNPNNFLVSNERIEQPQENKMLTVDYGPYQKIKDDFYPSQIHIEAVENQDKTIVAIKYRKMDLNVSISFPFSIPNGYEQITLD